MSLYQWINESERAKVLQWINCLAAGKPLKIIDIGCGYGAYLKPLHKLGHSILGVEVNPKIVEVNRAQGLQCKTPEEFNHSPKNAADLLILSHVIEHFSPADLILFVDSYLDHLKPGGHILIATPLLSDYFYDDFDHIKPYQPTGIQMVFSSDNAQVQYYSRNKLELKDLWYRKSYFRIHHAKARKFRTFYKLFLKLTDAISVLFYAVSLRKVGKTDGWVGLFQKKA